MALMNAVSCCLLVLLSGACAFKQDAAAPMRKVVDLLKSVKADVEAEGKKEAAEFKAYTKYCAKNTDEKEYEIGRSQKDIKSMTARIGVLTQDIGSLKEELETLAKDTASFKKQLDSAVAKRAGEAKNYSAQAKSMTDSIIALEKAIQAVKEGRGEFAGLAQVTAMGSKVLSSAGQLNLLQLTSAQGGQPKGQVEARDGVTDTLRDLKREFIQNKHDLDIDEENAKGAFGKLEEDLTSQLKVAKEDTDEKTATQTAKEVEKAQLDKDLAAEKKSLGSDESFLKELTKTCAGKVKAAEERKKARAGELDALGKAIAHITEDASLLQAKTEMPIRNHLRRQPQASSLPEEDETANMAEVRSVEQASAIGSSLSFLQRHLTASDPESKMAKLEAMSTRMNVPLLSLAVLKVKAAHASNPYASTSNLIKEMVADLEKGAATQSSLEAHCEKIEKANTKDIAESKGKIEQLTAGIESNDALVAKETKASATLEKQIAELKENLAEAKKLRAEDKKDNAAALEEAKAGQKAATAAKEVLSAYYKPSFLEVSQPKITTADYGKEATERSKGVLGLLEEVIADFKKEITKTEEEEKKAASDYETFKKKSSTDLSSKETELKTKKKKISEAKVELLESKESLENQQKINKKATEALEESKAMCAPEIFEDKKAARNANIASLKKILAELEGMASR